MGDAPPNAPFLPNGDRLPGFDDLENAPYYGLTPADLGGGAVGLVPYQMHGLASSPPYAGGPAPERLNSDFMKLSPNSNNHFDIVIEHYGPVYASGRPLIAEMWADGEWVDLSTYFTYVVSERTVRVEEGSMKPEGLFRFRPVRQLGAGLFCDDTFIQLPTSPHVADYEYRIEFLVDCDNNGEEDDQEIAAVPGLDDNPQDGILDVCQPGVCDCDLAPPGSDPGSDVDVFDLLAYLDLWFASDAAAERTGDNPAAINVFDLLDYLDCWFAYSGGTC